MNRKLIVRVIGAILLIEAAAMLPALLLPLRPGMSVLDMCAAPGGKTTQMAALSGGQIKYLAGDPRLNAPLCDDDELKLVVPMVRNTDFGQVVVEKCDRKLRCSIAEQLPTVLVDPVYRGRKCHRFSFV